MKDKVINIASNNDEYTLEIKERLINLLRKNGYDYFDGFSKHGELNITIGGDGAFLRGVRESNFSKRSCFTETSVVKNPSQLPWEETPGLL